LINRIFVTGAPGSKWSSVVKNIYYSASIDRSDHSQDRSYAHRDQYSGAPMHLGAYFDPGMEFGDWFGQLSCYSKTECEHEFDRPFDGVGTRIVKSHEFANHLCHLQLTWPDTPIVLVHRSTDACIGWWLRCGGFDISYPNYRPYYKDIPTIIQHIERQNSNIESAWDLPGTEVFDNQELAQILNIQQPPDTYQQNYPDCDIRVKVLVR
jgi:hypothetical protein